MTKRKPITPKMKVDALLWHFDITCRLCGQMIHPNQDIQWDHIWALALGGPHDISNIVPVCFQCHRKKTSGSGATTAGSDIGKIKKMRHILTGKMVVKKPSNELADALDFLLGKPKRKFPKSKKLRSRNTFQKRKVA